MLMLKLEPSYWTVPPLSTCQQNAHAVSKEAIGQPQSLLSNDIIPSAAAAATGCYDGIRFPSPCLEGVLEVLDRQCSVALQLALSLTTHHIRAGQQLVQLPLLPGLLNQVTKLGQPQAALIHIVGQVIIPGPQHGTATAADLYENPT